MRALGSGSALSTRSSSWPRGRCFAPGRWPASNASFSRTSRTHEILSPCSSRRAHLVHAHERDLARRLGEQLRDRLAAGAVRAQRLGQVVGHLDVEAAHQRDELGALVLLQARVARLLGADRRRRAILVVVRRIDLHRVGQLQQLAEQAVVERVGIAGRQVGAAGAADQQRVAGEHAIVEHEARRVVRCDPACASTRTRSLPTTSVSPSSTRTSANGAAASRCITTRAPS